MKTSLTPKKIIISRTDSIGDVCLTLPMCKALKEKFPEVKLVFLGKTYTQSVIKACPYVDDFLDFSQLEKLGEQEAIEQIKQINADNIIHVFPNKSVAKWAKKAGVITRIGTSHRLFHWTTCNLRLNFTRKNSELHEAQLNFKLLKPFGINVPAFEEIQSWRLLEAHTTLPDSMANQFVAEKKIILHCKSQGSAVEWGLDNFMKLAEELANKGVQVFFTGTENEGRLFREKLPKHKRIVDVSGKMSLAELMAFIQKCDILIAASTGPLHLAGLLGTQAIGLFSSRRPIHPGRWKALGAKSIALVYDENCETCRQGKTCACIEKIPVEKVVECCGLEG